MGMPIFDCFNTAYKHPFGAIRRGQPSIFNIRLPKSFNVSGLTLVMFRPGYKERFIELVLQDESSDDNIFTCVFTPNNVGVHQYYFTGVIDGRRRYIKRRGANIGVFTSAPAPRRNHSRAIPQPKRQRSPIAVLENSQ